jgi:hypothetical protein
MTAEGRTTSFRSAAWKPSDYAAPDSKPARYRPDDALLAFLEAL